ncbi:nuclear transport factor 2 family protein [Mesorhizobium sp. VK9D]|uniref:YybH family protein n=1 Tax=Mesorhizobium australafricanum TaxID=3072311 RepID=UPI002A244E4D|nr:nuclear transport factor 2 family protein [Mesorhizobium sp. VK9D]MDX8455982.1 nuclear transport factor 2 family protein [Mesorhizobium sp. VK9D]
MPIFDDLQEIWDLYVAAYRLGDAAGCAAIFTDDAEVHSPYGPPARGRAAIEALHGIWVQHAGPNKTLQVIEAGSSGNLAWTLAAYSEGEATGNGTSLSILERQADGGWLIRMCSLNSTDAGG